MPNKKALSPLVSSVLMLAFAIVLGVLIISWGQKGEALTTEPGKADCDKARLRVIEIKNQPQICYQDQRIYFTLENNGAMDLNGIKISVLDDIVYQADIEKDLKVGDIVKLSSDYGDTAEIKKVKFIPILGTDGMPKYCPNNGIEWEEIKAC